MIELTKRRVETRINSFANHENPQHQHSRMGNPQQIVIQKSLQHFQPRDVRTRSRNGAKATASAMEFNAQLDQLRVEHQRGNHARAQKNLS
jgi:hypothetical protein